MSLLLAAVDDEPGVGIDGDDASSAEINFAACACCRWSRLNRTSRLRAVRAPPTLQAVSASTSVLTTEAEENGERMTFSNSVRPFLRNTRAGATAIAAAAVIVMAVGGAALTTDNVRLVDQRDTLKSAADSASVAASLKMNRMLEADSTLSDMIHKDDLDDAARRYIELNLSHLAAATLVGEF